jgi:hypothetical protein
MMPMRVCRKARNMEKVEILCRTATAQNILPGPQDKTVHACAMQGSAADTIACGAVQCGDVSMPPSRGYRGDARAERDRPVMACAAAGRMLDCGFAGYESFRRRILGMLRKSVLAASPFAKICMVGVNLLAMQRGAL